MASITIPDCHLYKLPNELLLQILVPIPTPQLLPLTPTSHRLCSLILRLLHNRLVIASELQSHSLLLECYHPSAKLTEPPYFCTYQGTDELDMYDEPSEIDTNLAKRLGEMRNMYSRFRPYRRELEKDGKRVRRTPGDIPGSRTFPGTASDRHKGETVKQILNLDGHELFTQLVAQSNLVKIGPRNGLFTCFVEVEEGVVRVWREWLKAMALERNNVTSEVTKEVVTGSSKGKEVARAMRDTSGDLDDENILWVSSAKNTGLKFNIRERKMRVNAPILINAEEDLPVSYEIEYDELLIRTSHLLLMLEKSFVQEDNTSGKAVVFGSFG